MIPEIVNVIGLRLSPDDPEPALYTLWFLDSSGATRVALRGGRVQWVLRVGDLGLVGDDDADLTGFTRAPSEIEAVCSVPGLLYSLTEPADGDPAVARLALDMLDDLVASTGVPLSASAAHLLDTIAVRLFEGASLPNAVGDGGPAAVEAVLAGLGRVFSSSDFLRSPD